MAVGIGNIQTLYQTFYPENDLTYLIPDNLPFLNAIPKEGNLQGDVMDSPWQYGTPQGYSQDFNVAQSQAGNAPRAVRASLRASQAYKVIEFFDKDIVLSQGEASYADLFTDTVDGGYASFYNNLDLDFHGEGQGWRGTIQALPGQANPVTGATLPANTVSVTTALPLEATFDVDQQLQIATYTGFPLAGSIFPPSDGRLPTTLSPAVQVLSVDPVAQTLLLSDVGFAAVGAFLVQNGGAIGFNSTNLNGSFIGLRSYNPYAGVAQNDNLCGANRSVYPTRLAGYWFDGSKLSMEDGIKRLSGKMSQGGARTSTLGLMNPLDVDVLDSKLMTYGRVPYSDYMTANYGFSSIMIQGAAGRIDIVADPHQPRGFAQLLDPNSFVLHHALGLPHVVDIQGRTAEQALNFDGRTIRLRAYAQLRCRKPHTQGVVKLPQVLNG